jgi:nucleoside-diphosphate-sugar epimerase
VPGLSIVGIDKHAANTALLRRLQPDVEVIEADLAMPGSWQDAFADADSVLISQAQIGGLDEREFVDNNVTATGNIVDAMRQHRVPYFVHVSSSVVNSAADDFYTRTKAAQERLIDKVVDIPHVVLRPTLMFGWFDRKHLGWIRRFMSRTPIFPIPGSGKFIRQPLFAGDFAAIIIASMRERMTGTFDISGLEKIPYVDMIRLIRSTVQSRSFIVHIPIPIFWWLLFFYGKIDSNPPFTTRQLEALVIPETFAVINWPGIFGVTPTPLKLAIEQTFLDPQYSGTTLEF